MEFFLSKFTDVTKLSGEDDQYAWEQSCYLEGSVEKQADRDIMKAKGNANLEMGDPRHQ